MSWLDLVCAACGWRSGFHPQFSGCQQCGGVLLADVPNDFVRSAQVTLGGRGIAGLVLPDLEPATGLGEGGTPLVAAHDLGRSFGLRGLYIKNEAVNPTGSYKDRMNAVAVAVAARLGIHQVATSSTGNQAVSLAAFAAAAGLRCDTFLPDVAPRQAAAEVERLGGYAWVTGWDHRQAVIAELIHRHGYGYVGRNFPRPLANPYGLEGYKSIAYEIVHQLGGNPPDVVLMPSCGGDGIFGTWRGFDELARAGLTSERPRMVGCGVSAAPSVAAAWRAGRAHVSAVAPQPSIALSLVDAQGGDHALWAIRESGGSAITVGDPDLVRAMRTLGGLGVLAEPAGAAGLAGLGNGPPEPVRAGEIAVVVVTGGGGRWPAALADLPGGTRAAQPLRAVLDSLAAAETARL